MRGALHPDDLIPAGGVNAYVVCKSHGIATVFSINDQFRLLKFMKIARVGGALGFASSSSLCPFQDLADILPHEVAIFVIFSGVEPPLLIAMVNKEETGWYVVGDGCILLARHSTLYIPSLVVGTYAALTESVRGLTASCSCACDVGQEGGMW